VLLLTTIPKYSNRTTGEEVSIYHTLSKNDNRLGGQSHRLCDQVTTYVRPVRQPNRKGSQINHATSRGGRGQSHDQKNQVLRS